jgi:adenine-specific DNA-methyltransferase
MFKHVEGPRLPVARPVQLDQRDVDWADLIVGDSRIVMEALLGCDLLRGQVQMIYLDPPGEAQDDAGYLRDRLVRCRVLLHPSGSAFVRTSDESFPSVGGALDAVFGPDNFCGVATLRKPSEPINGTRKLRPDWPMAGSRCVEDYLLWYGRDLSHVNYRHLLVLRQLQAQDPTILGEGEERRRRCGILLDGSIR